MIVNAIAIRYANKLFTNNANNINNGKKLPKVNKKFRNFKNSLLKQIRLHVRKHAGRKDSLENYLLGFGF